MTAGKIFRHGDVNDGSAHGHHSSGRRPRRGTLRAGDLSSVPPLHWWRRLSADAFTDTHQEVLRNAISGFGMLGEPCWPDAAMGDAAAAVGVALRAIKRRRTPSPGLDLVMSALLRCAIAGNAGAIHALTHVLSQMAARDPSCALIAKSWQSSTIAEQHRHILHGG